jgi:DNA replication licensing factor MCM2
MREFRRDRRKNHRHGENDENTALTHQGFRKYVHQSTDNEELISFLLGQIIKEKVQLHRHQRGTNPESVRVTIKQLENRAKELEIYDVKPFLAGKLFRNNGYKVVGGEVEKVFTRVRE